MKITKRQLRRIIKEEKAKLLDEAEFVDTDTSDLINSLAEAVNEAERSIEASLDDVEDVLAPQLVEKTEALLSLLDALTADLNRATGYWKKPR